MGPPTLQEMSLKEAYEPFSSNIREPIHEDRRLQIEELDEWRTHKLRTHDKPKLCQNELNTFPRQLKEMSLKEAYEPFSSNIREPIHEDRRLQIEELDEWRTHKLRTHDKPKLCQNELNTFPRQLKVGDKVLLDAADPHIVTTTPNEEIPPVVLIIFPIRIVEVSHPKFGTFKVNNTCLKPYFDENDSRNEEYKLLKPV
ncbi:hypothetical protein GOBAR_AA33511 [Gossypium barbadense]|uniref:Uncharacterized protein n=1 Tax=Gossypium barbadense TaxID=3634 RepID=A0A2P5W7X0_GOSBA|nr:hypothetical protein GOBAR_AA33511 [Gossypium barbadense]